MDFRASEMPRVINCPGSKQLEALYPDESGDAAKEGTAAAWVASNIINGGKPESYLNTTIDGVYVDQDMLDYIEFYISCLPKGGRAEDTQTPVSHDGHVLTGTPDYWFFDAPAATLRIFDLKDGYGWVEPYRNWQLLSYAILVSSSIPNFEKVCSRIELAIIQPRASHPDGPFRKWAFDAVLLRNYTNQLFGGMSQAALAEPPVRTGDHCRYCRALLHCHAAGAAVGYALDYSDTAKSTELSADRLGLELELCQRAKKILDQRLVALEEYGINLNKKGTIIPGWEARNSVGNLTWNSDAILAIGDAMKINLRAPEKPMTPTQALNKGLITENLIKSLASRPPGGMKLKRVDDARAKRILSNG